jgi:hypothetical protein
MKLSSVLVASMVLAGAIFTDAKASRAEVVCDSPSMLDTLGPIQPNRHCWRINGTPARDRTIPGPWEVRTGGGCQGYSGLYKRARVYWRECHE